MTRTKWNSQDTKILKASHRKQARPRDEKKMFRDYREQLDDERLKTERAFLLTVLARKARKSSFTRRKNVSMVDQVNNG